MWLGIPVLFVTAVLGLVALPMVFLHSSVELYAGMFGAAAAVAAVTSNGAHWRRAWQRSWLRWPYVAAVAALGVVLDGVTVSAYVALLLGVPAAVALTALLLRRQPVPCVIEADAG